MRSRRWMVVLIVGLAGLLAVTGCKKRSRKGGIGSDDVVGVTGTDVYGGPLEGDRFVDGMEMRGQFSVVYFDYDSSQIRDSERAQIEEVASYLSSNPGVNLIVEGHCDERGSNEYNLALGERRALAIRAYLVGLGIDGARVTTKSFGEEQPVAAGHDEMSWSQNRRGEFVLVQ